MKIAYVCPFYAPAICGVGQVVRELAERMAAQGHEVHVFCSDWDKERRASRSVEVLNGVHVHRCFHLVRVANFATIFPSVFFKLLFGKFDLIHSHMYGHAHVFFSFLAAKITGVAHVHTTHCPWTPGNRSFFGEVMYRYNFLSNLTLLYADRIIAITPWEVSFIRARWGSRRRIVVIPNGMDKILYKKISPNTYKKEHGISEKLLVLFFGRLSFAKGPEKLALVARKLASSRDDVAFVYVGPDEGKEAEVRAILKNVPHTYILGPLRGKAKVAAMYQAADIYALPSYREGLPLTIFEAMASGLPLVSCPVNGIPYEVKDPENGFLVPYGNLVALEKALVTLLDDKKLRAQIGKNNKKRAQSYTWDAILEKTQRVYRSVL